MKTKRYSIEFMEELDKKLESLAKEKNTTKADLIRRSLALYSFVEEKKKDGSMLVLVGPENEILYKIALSPRSTK